MLRKILCLLLGFPISAFAETWDLQAPETAFDYDSPNRVIAYQPLSQSSRAWDLCVSYPHLKDAYWLSVNFGMVEEARRLGVSFRLNEAGGYPNLERQIQQIDSCIAQGADALIVGAVSFDGLADTVKRAAEEMRNG